MRRLLTRALAALTLAAAASSATAGGLVVSMDRSVRLPLARDAADVLVSNPSVADVALVDERTLLVMGRLYGVTNLVVLDANRRVLFSGPVTVTSASSGETTIFRAGTQYNYACAPRCERTPLPGESKEAYGEFAAAYTSHIGRAADGAKK